MELHNFLLGSLVFLTVLLVGTFLIVDINKNYEEIINEPLNETAYGSINDNITKISDTTTLMQNKVFNNSVGVTGIAESLYYGSYGAITYVTSTFSIITDFVGLLIGGPFGIEIPPIFSVIATAAIMIMIVFAVVYLIFRLLG